MEQIRVSRIHIRFPLPSGFLHTMVLPLNQYQRNNLVLENLLLTI